MKFDLSSQDALSLALVVAACLLICLPVAVHGLPLGHDGIHHLVSALHFTGQLWEGEWFPRWLSAANDGLGAPTFFFYPPIPYYAAALFGPPSGDLEQLARVLGVTAVLAALLSGMAAYVWLRESVGPRAALAGGLIYLLLPYHLFIDLYHRAALAEIWSFVWLPLALLFAGRIARGVPLAWIGLALAIAGLTASHLPSLELFGLLPPLYALALATGPERGRVLVHAGLASGVGFALAAVYWMPALLMQDAIDAQAWWRSGFGHEGNFLFDRMESRTNWLVSKAVAATAVLGVVGAGLAYIGSRRRPSAEAQFWMLVAVVSLVLMLPVSAPLWSRVDLLAKVQFPWRLGGVLTLAVAALVALTVEQAARTRGWRDWRLPALVLAVAASLYVGWSAPISREGFWWARGWVSAHARHVHLEKYRDTVLCGATGPEYRPARVPEASYRQACQRAQETVPERPFAVLEDGYGEVALVGRGPRHVSLQVSTPVESGLVLDQWYFDGWRAVTGSGLPLPVEARPADGRVEIRVPAGDHRIRAELAPTAPELVGRALSLAGALVLAGGLVLGLRRRTAVRGAPPTRPEPQG